MHEPHSKYAIKNLQNKRTLWRARARERESEWVFEKPTNEQKSIVGVFRDDATRFSSAYVKMRDQGMRVCGVECARGETRILIIKSWEFRYSFET